MTSWLMLHHQSYEPSALAAGFGAVDLQHVKSYLNRSSPDDKLATIKCRCKSPSFFYRATSKPAA